ncbi:alpha/beta fold hydrolase [Geopsychrobacter electrodiphilus]|uniref:alpha/beta fold hydrolase n=1 Tax=Geopsychrobacter electrodiphilus TaxID=225196 RepID=UPI000374119C|nr:alpha/beta fold hydrolase [Geopsychrobacter electrodiphilus]
MNVRISHLWLLVVFGLLLLGGCGSDNNATNTAGSDPRITNGGTATVFARFDASTLPLPNDVAWAANNPAYCPNGQVCLPPAVGDSAEMAGLKQLVNAQAIPGLSPNMFLTLPLTGAVDSSTLNLLVFRIDDSALLTDLFAAAQAQPPNPAAIGAALAALDYRTQTDFVIVNDLTSGVVKLLPKTPFVPGAGYAVVAKQGLMDSNGYEAVSSFTMTALKSQTPFAADSPYASFEALRAAFNDGPTALFTIVGGVTNVLSGGAAPWTRSDVLVMWTFHTAADTLSLTPTTPGADTVAYPDGVIDPFNLTTAALKAGSVGFTTNALAWTNPTTGASSVTPVGIPAAAMLTGTGIPTDAGWNIYAGNFQSPLLDGSGTTTVTFRLTVPTSGTAPYPVVVFQHGITSSKDAALPIANTLAAAGYATLAIDAIYHGERTTPGAASGDGFFTSNLLEDRANIYQAAIDLWETVDVITAGIDIDPGTNPGFDLDSTEIEFVAHSLGSIIGSAFLSQETRVNKMVLSSPSAMLVSVLDETSLQSMQALVSSLGYTPGTTSYYVFLNLAQWLLDPADGTYMGIGANSTDNLLALSAYADPIVSNASTQVFLTNLGLTGTSIGVDPDAALTPSILSGVPGAYQYGLDPAGLVNKPVVHSFLLSPLFNTTEDPYYTGYDQSVQVNATTSSQAQVFYFMQQPTPL